MFVILTITNTLSTNIRFRSIPAGLFYVLINSVLATNMGSDRLSCYSQPSHGTTTGLKIGHAGGITRCDERRADRPHRHSSATRRAEQEQPARRVQAAIHTPAGMSNKQEPRPARNQHERHRA
jgi:hypothetical protein